MERLEGSESAKQRLTTILQTLRQQLTAAEVRRELAEALPHVVRDSAAATTKGAPTQPPPNRHPAR